MHFREKINLNGALLFQLLCGALGVDMSALPVRKMVVEPSRADEARTTRLFMARGEN